MLTIHLTDADIAECERIGDQRYGTYAEHGFGSDTHRTAKTKYENNRLGVFGEYVVARLCGQAAFDDWKANRAEFTNRKRHEAPADVGVAVQVKTVDGRNRNLVVPQYDRKQVDDAFVLVDWDRRTKTAYVVGWTGGRTLMDPQFWITSDRFGPLDPWRCHWRFPRVLLRPFDTLPAEYVHGE